MILTFSVKLQEFQYSTNEAELILEGHLKPDPFKYNQTKISTTYLEKTVLDFTPDVQYPKFNRPREPMHSIDTNLTSLPIMLENNVSRSRINFTQYARPSVREDVQFQNLTALLNKDEQELNKTMDEQYKPFTIEINKYEETERYKRFNVSYIESKFMSIGD